MLATVAARSPNPGGTCNGAPVIQLPPDLRLTRNCSRRLSVTRALVRRSARTISSSARRLLTGIEASGVTKCGAHRAGFGGPATPPFTEDAKLSSRARTPNISHVAISSALALRAESTRARVATRATRVGPRHPRPSARTLTPGSPESLARKPVGRPEPG